MGSKAESYYPPYEGKEPYIHLCFSDRDERKVRPLLRRLLLRGCRVWYCVGRTRDRSTQALRDRRMLGAGLTVVYLTEAVRADTELKTRLLVCQKARQPILVLNTDGGDSGLSLGLTAEASSSPMGGNAPDACDAILHGPEFSQVFLGDPLPIYDRLWLRRLSVTLAVLALLLVAGGTVYKVLHPPAAPAQIEIQPEDQVVFQDPILREAIREAVGGGPITQEALARITVLPLSHLPESMEDLALLPNLSTLILSQEAAQGAPQQPGLYEKYTLILAGGEQP